MNIILEKEILDFIKFCENELIDIYIVGGAIRDNILGLNTLDYDFALASDYKDALYKLSKVYNCKHNDTYQSIKFHIDKYNIEISHCRKEYGILDNRHPYKIEFVDDIKVDSQRRDFSINALYYKDGIIYDFYNGLYHIKNKELIVIGDTLIRFKEDSMRILRMIRFASIGYKISDKDKKIILDNYNLLQSLSLEAFDLEFNKILSIKNIGIINQYKVVFEAYYKTKFPDIKKLLLLNSIDEMKTYLGIKNNSKLYKYRNLIISDDKVQLTKTIYNNSKEIVLELVCYYDKLNNTKIKSLYDDIMDSFYSKTQLNITTEEIIYLIKDKRKTSYYIDKVSYAIIEGEIENNKEQIKNYILGSVK